MQYSYRQNRVMSVGQNTVWRRAGQSMATDDEQKGGPPDPNSNHAFISYLNENTMRMIIQSADDTELRVESSLIKQQSLQTTYNGYHLNFRVRPPLFKFTSGDLGRVT